MSTTRHRITWKSLLLGVGVLSLTSASHALELVAAQQSSSLSNPGLGNSHRAFAWAESTDGTRWTAGVVRGHAGLADNTVEIDAGNASWPTVLIEPSSGPALALAFEQGGSTDGGIQHLELDAAGNAYVLGEFTQDTLAIGGGLADLEGPASFVASISPGGHVRWAFSFPGTNAPELRDIAVGATHLAIGGRTASAAYDVDPDPSSTVLVSAADRDPLVLRYTLDGDYADAVVMREVLADPGCSKDGVEALAFRDDGVLLVGGSFVGTTDFAMGPPLFEVQSPCESGFVAAYGNDGQPQWVRVFGSDQAGEPARVERLHASGNRAAVAGRFHGYLDAPAREPLSIESSPADATDRFVATLDASGWTDWAALIDSGGSIDWTGIAMAPSGHVALVGNASQFGGSVDFDPGEADSDTPAGGVLAVYRADGALQVAHGFGLNVRQRDVDWIDNHEIAAVGDFNQSFDVDPGLGVELLASNNGNNWFHARWATDPTLFRNGFEP